MPLVCISLLAGCGASGRVISSWSNADGSRMQRFQANSEPFAVSRGVSEDDVISEFVHRNNFCGANYEVIRKRRIDPNNFSLVIVEADVRCPPTQMASGPGAATGNSIPGRSASGGSSPVLAPASAPQSGVVTSAQGPTRVSPGSSRQPALDLAQLRRDAECRRLGIQPNTPRFSQCNFQLLLEEVDRAGERLDRAMEEVAFGTPR